MYYRIVKSTPYLKREACDNILQFIFAREYMNNTFIPRWVTGVKCLYSCLRHGEGKGGRIFYIKKNELWPLNIQPTESSKSWYKHSLTCRESGIVPWKAGSIVSLFSTWHCRVCLHPAREPLFCICFTTEVEVWRLSYFSSLVNPLVSVTWIRKLCLFTFLFLLFC